MIGVIMKFFLIIPFIFFAFQIFISYKFPEKMDLILCKKIYFFLAFLWEALFLFIYYDDIKNFTIFNNSSLSLQHFNFILIALIIFLVILALNWIFISNKTISSIKISGTEITLNELKKVQYKENLSAREKDTLYDILNCQCELMEYIECNIESWLLNSSNTYLDIYTNIINKYCNYRDIYCEISLFSPNTVIDSLHHLINKNINSDILGALTSDGIWQYKSPNNIYTFFMKISLLNLDSPLLVIMQSNLLLNSDYIVLIELINYLEINIDNQYYIQLLSNINSNSSPKP